MPLRIHTWEEPEPDRIGATPEAFLAAMPGPIEVRLAGRDRDRHRVAVGMLHGNEPSGLVAIHRWLRAGVRPAVDTSLFVVAVEAARLAPGFAHRMPPGQRDLNRAFFGPYNDPDGTLARALFQRITRRPCEALVDMHNNTGHNPPYGVLTKPDGAHMVLTSLFSDIACLLQDLRLGTLLEAIGDRFPAVSIECGQARTEAADDVAARGLARFLSADDLALKRVPAGMSVFEHPIRVCLRAGTRLAFADQRVPDVDLTLVEHIERHNFRTPAPGTVIGWLAPGAEWPFVARDPAGHDVSHVCFVLDDDTLRWRGDMVPIMMTTDARVAFADCLCYLMRTRSLGAPGW
ncbi:hypothetical protein [Haliangium sp.]|uniref:hypothetical protein n=1 Tax=Haliangium sp. TaxID=2663208 RepID=UPI003D137650